ncbi:uncharacterized protein KZ484_020325 [Pholidichthys leucotaenia]
MLCCRWLLPLLTLYLLLEEISAALLPNSFRNTREVNWLDQEVFSRLSDPSEAGDLSVGDAGEMGRDVGDRPTHSETYTPETEQPHVQLHRPNQFQYNRKTNEKRKKVAPLDSIGSFQMSNVRNRKDEPAIYSEDYRD